MSRRIRRRGAAKHLFFLCAVARDVPFLRVFASAQTIVAPARAAVEPRRRPCPTSSARPLPLPQNVLEGVQDPDPRVSAQGKCRVSPRHPAPRRLLVRSSRVTAVSEASANGAAIFGRGVERCPRLPCPCCCPSPRWRPRWLELGRQMVPAKHRHQSFVLGAPEVDFSRQLRPDTERGGGGGSVNLPKKASAGYERNSNGDSLGGSESPEERERRPNLAPAPFQGAHELHLARVTAA